MNTRENVIRYTAVTFAGIALCAWILFLPAQTHAQAGLLGIERSLSIRMAPQFPQSGDTVSLTVTSPILDISQSEVTWHSQKETLAEGRGVDTVYITLGALGTETTIEVFVTTSDTNASGRVTIIPTEIDLLVDSDAYIPPFYRGRALPSVGTTVHFEAKPHFILPSGARIANEDIVFTWRKNKEIIPGLSGRGRATARIPIQHMYGSDVVSVDVRTDDYSLSNQATFTLTPIKPIVTLYQNHPLFGLMYHRALGAASAFTENEITFEAVPYFVQADDAADPALTLDWRVNGQAVPSGNTRESSITINADNSSGSALLQLRLTHKTNYFLDSQGSWDITLSSRPPSETQFMKFTP